MLLSRNLKKMAKNCHFYQRVCNYFSYPCLKTGFFFFREKNYFSREKEGFVCFSVICAKLFWSAKFQRVTHATFGNSIEN